MDRVVSADLYALWIRFHSLEHEFVKESENRYAEFKELVGYRSPLRRAFCVTGPFKTLESVECKTCHEDIRKLAHTCSVLSFMLLWLFLPYRKIMFCAEIFVEVTMDRLSSGWGEGANYSRYLMPKIGSLTVPVVCSTHGHVSIIIGEIHVTGPFFLIIRKMYCSWGIASSVIRDFMGFLAKSSCRSFRAYWLRFENVSFIMGICYFVTASVPMIRYFSLHLLTSIWFLFSLCVFLVSVFCSHYSRWALRSTLWGWWPITSW